LSRQREAERVFVPVSKAEDGSVWVSALIANTFKPKELNVEARFLVDTGAGMSVIPQKTAEKLELKPMGKMMGTLAAGKTVTFPIYYVYLNVAGEGLVTLVAGSPREDEYLLGADVLEVLEFQVDIARKRLLKPVKRLRIRKLMWKGRMPFAGLDTRSPNAESGS